MTEGAVQRILIVEDDRQLRSALQLKLQREGFETVEASSGKEGLALALADHPDLILLDIVMPEMNGEEMLTELRRDKWGESVPVILLTNLSFLEDDDTKERADAYVLKSETELEGLVEKIREHLKS